MPVWIEVEYQATASSRVARPVCCDHCQTEFVYWQKLESFARESRLLGSGKPDLKRQLSADQRQQRRTGFEYVPCPECLLLPTYMAQAKHFVRYTLQLFLGIGSLLAAAVLAILGWVTSQFFGWSCFGPGLYVLAGVFALVGIPFTTAGILTSALYDPNSPRRGAERQRLADAFQPLHRTSFESEYLEQAERDLHDQLARARRRPNTRLDAIEVPVWIGFEEDEEQANRVAKLPTGEEYLFDLTDEPEEYDAFDLKRDVDGVPVVFRCVLRVYRPTNVRKGR